jgi:nitroimidazol reductase NimA-like FMN-containing flavoprotein (pyridoxamine 5'-phosphate oxidase superfamily)
MRRKQREVSDQQQQKTIIDRARVCRVAMVDAGKPYVIPMSFGYRIKKDQFVFYLHCAKEGRKNEILKVNPQVCIEVDTMGELIAGDTGCDYSCRFESFIGFGEAVFVRDDDEKKIALEAIMEHQTGRGDFTFEEKVLAVTQVIKVSLHTASGKRH